MANIRRKMPLVDYKVQWAIAWQAVLHWFGFTLAAVALLAVQFLFVGLVTSLHDQWPTIGRLALAMSMAMMLLMPLYVYNSLKFSHRVVGPVMQIRRILRELGEGKPFSPAKFRKGDYWPEMADELNQAVKVLREQRSAVEPHVPDHSSKSQHDDMIVQSL